MSCDGVPQGINWIVATWDTCSLVVEEPPDARYILTVPLLFMILSLYANAAILSINSCH